MISDDKLKANRENAQHSTGPKTPEGKKRSSLSALRHGLTGRVVLMPDEDLQAYEAFSKRWVDDLKPAGIVEETLVQQLADCQWVLSRAQSHIEALEAMGIHHFSAELDTGQPETDNAIAAGQSAEYYCGQMDKISRYRGRWVREFNTALKLLKQEQAERRHLEKHTLEQAIDLYKFNKMLGEPFHPPDVGFVLTGDHVEQKSRIADRVHQAGIAKTAAYNKAEYLKMSQAA